MKIWPEVGVFIISLRAARNWKNPGVKQPSREITGNPNDSVIWPVVFPMVSNSCVKKNEQKADEEWN